MMFLDFFFRDLFYYVFDMYLNASWKQKLM